jgi:hypothetical protein
MTAGDFKGDGQHEIAGLSFTVAGIQLVIYKVDPNSLAITSSLVLTTPIPRAGYRQDCVRARARKPNANDLYPRQNLCELCT